MQTHTPYPHILSIACRWLCSPVCAMTPAMHHHHEHPEHEKKALVARLRKIRGQVEAVERMIEANTDCPDVLTQVISARRALKSFGDTIIHSHMHECIEHA